MIASDTLLPKPIRIYNSLDNYYFQNDKKVISYNKTTRLFKDVENFFPNEGMKKYEVFSVLGYIEAIRFGYIICSEQTAFVGKILNSKVFKINKFIYIPNQGNEINEEDKKYIKMLDDFLKRNPLYYSDTFDLTVSFKMYETQIKKKIIPSSFIFPYTISHFAWNYSIAKIFDYKGMNDFIFPVINGYFDTRIVNYNEDDLSFIVIGRKDDRRSGMRFLFRGADLNGNVANFVETEEILVYREQNGIGHILSFLQIRGSIPIIFTQEPNFQLNPLIRPKDDVNINAEVFKLHMDECIQNYNNVCIINLIDRKKDQKTIGEYYQTVVQYYNTTNYNNQNENANKVDFTWFDFHHECRKMKYENLSKLMKMKSVSKGLNNFNFTHITFNYSKVLSITSNKIDEILHSENFITLVKTQNGIFRTNCIDCLDRTNVVQSVFGRYFLHKMLQELKLSEGPNGDPFQKFKPVFESTFKLLWADHGDSLSLSYSGTGAMKSDFVRTGKRTLMGNLQDGYLTSKRFYINNFWDGYNQDCHDYFLGSISPKKNTFKNHNGGNLKVIFPITVFLSYILYFFLVSMALPKDYQDNFSRKLFRIIVFFGSLILTFMSVFGMLKKTLIDLHTRHP